MALGEQLVGVGTVELEALGLRERELDHGRALGGRRHLPVCMGHIHRRYRDLWGGEGITVSEGRGLGRGAYIYPYIYTDISTHLRPTEFRPIADSREYYSPRQEQFFSFHYCVSSLRKNSGSSTNLIRILNPQDELPACFLRKQVIEQRSPQAPQMQKPCRTGSEPRARRRDISNGLYRGGVVVPAGQCGAGGPHSSQQSTHTAGAGEGGCYWWRGVVPPGRRVAGHCCGGRAAVERRGMFGGGHAAGCGRRVGCSTQRRPSAQRLIVGTPPPQPPPSNNRQISKQSQNILRFPHPPPFCSLSRVCYPSALVYSALPSPLVFPRGRAA